MKFRKRILVPLIVLTSVAIWTVGQRKMAATQRSVEELRSNMAALSNRLQTASLDLQSKEDEVRQQESTRQELGKALATAEREHDKISPESRWATLPSDLPSWDSESPYVWVRKEIMKELRTHPFAEDGSLIEMVVPILALSQEQVAELNQTLPKLLAQYRQIEATNVVITDQHLRSVGPIKDGKAITVSWEPSDEGNRLKNEYEAALRETLGEQRTELLLAVDGGELNRRFGESVRGSGLNQKITLLRHAKGGFNVAVDKGTSSMSTSVSKDRVEFLNRYIPEHVRHYFAELLDSPK